MSALFRWPCCISIQVSPAVAAPPFSAGHAAFPLSLLIICFPLSLLMSALFRRPCSISVHVSPTVTAGVRPFFLAMQHFYFNLFPRFLYSCLPGPVPAVPFLVNSCVSLVSGLPLTVWGSLRLVPLLFPLVVCPSCLPSQGCADHYYTKVLKGHVIFPKTQYCSGPQ